MTHFGYKLKYNVGNQGRFTSIKTFLTKDSARKFAEKIKEGKERDWYKQASKIRIVKNKLW